MKKNLQLFLVFILISNFISAQKATVTWGNLSKNDYYLDGLTVANDGSILKYCSEVKKFHSLIQISTKLQCLQS